jgi:aminoglycoside 3-N-acetyltransferase
MRVWLRRVLASLVPRERLVALKHAEYKLRKRAVAALPEIGQDDFERILRERLKIGPGDHVMVHASMDMMRCTLSPAEMLAVLLDVVGADGTLCAPTFPRVPSADWMRSPKPFDHHKTPSAMGLLSERIRRHPAALRSLHPTKSVAAIGALAGHLTADHHKDTLPFGTQSPFWRLVEAKAKVVGLGVPMSYLSLVHVAEDTHPDEFPVGVWEPETYGKICIGSDGDGIEVRSRVHRMDVMAKANPERFVRQHVPRDRYGLANWYLTPFFWVDADAVYQALVVGMRQGETIYDFGPST